MSIPFIASNSWGDYVEYAIDPRSCYDLPAQACERWSHWLPALQAFHSQRWLRWEVYGDDGGTKVNLCYKPRYIKMVRTFDQVMVVKLLYVTKCEFMFYNFYRQSLPVSPFRDAVLVASIHIVASTTDHHTWCPWRHHSILPDLISCNSVASACSKGQSAWLGKNALRLEDD